MGYTHYFRHQKTNQAIWDKIVSDCKKLYDHMPAHSESSGGHHKDALLKLTGCFKYGSEPFFGKDEIWFNGEGEMSHESFTLFRQPNARFHFCKTARKPYDLMVQGCLLVYKYHSPDTIDLNSDGNSFAWSMAEKFVKDVLGYNSCFSTIMEVHNTVSV